MKLNMKVMKNMMAWVEKISAEGEEKLIQMTSNLVEKSWKGEVIANEAKKELLTN